MINTTNINEALQQTSKGKNKAIVLAQDDSFNRKILEQGKASVLLSIERGNRKDNVRGINSGLNPILGRIATKNNISLGIDLNEIRSLDKKEKAIRLSKIKQNIGICKKTHTKIINLNFKDRKDASSILISLGASSKQAKQSISFNT